MRNTPAKTTNRTNHQPPLANLLNEIWNQTWADHPVTNRSKTPATNIIEHDDRFELELSIPGFTKDAIEVNIDNDQLVVKAEVREKDKEMKNYRLREWSYKSFSKTFNLSDVIDQNSVDASYEAGILKITLHKKEEALPQPPKMIEIK